MKKIIDTYLYENSSEITLHELIYETKNYIGTIILVPDVCFDESPVIKVYLRREETDSEYAKRKNLERLREEQKEQIEFAQYKRLKKKYGDLNEVD